MRESKTGIASKSLLARCLLGKESGFCKPELFAARPDQSFLRSNGAKRAPRSRFHKGLPAGQRCALARGSDKLEHECLKDRAWRKRDCAGRDDRCQLKIVNCDCKSDHKPPKFEPASKRMKAGARLIAQRCKAQRADIVEGGGGSPGLMCCGIPVMDRAYCLFMQSICHR